MNLFCLVAWIVILAINLVRVSKGRNVDSGTAICAMVVAVVHFASEWISKGG